MPIFKYCAPVRSIRDDLMRKSPTLEGLKQEPVVYRWWFPSIPNKLKRTDIDFSKIEKRTIEGKDYYALYVGIGKDCIQRFSWHITQHHTPSNVEYGTLSTLRQTLSAVLDINMTKSEDEVNQLMDTCYLEWNLYPKKSKNDLEKIESQLLDKGYYPLNIDKNKRISKEWLRDLKRLRKTHKQ